MNEEKNKVSSRQELKKLAFAAIFTALAATIDVLTTYIPGLNLSMPLGGKVFGLSMLPVMIVGYICGLKYGLFSGLILGIVNLLFDGFSIHIASIFLDYLVPFTLIGLTGIFKNGYKKTLVFILSALSVCFLRYLCHSISGIVVLDYREFAISNGYSPLMWSFILYNIPYMASSTALCIVVGLLVRKPIYSLVDKSLQLS